MKRKIQLFLALLFTVLTMTVASVPVSAGWCQSFATYTAWRDWKPALFVYKGRGNPNPTNVSVKYNGQSVPNAEYGVQTNSPQIDDNNGWVGYYIAKRFYGTNWGWDDDWRWSVNGCIP